VDGNGNYSAGGNQGYSGMNTGGIAGQVVKNQYGAGAVAQQNHHHGYSEYENSINDGRGVLHHD
jgi:hypothetical protein